MKAQRILLKKCISEFYHWQQEYQHRKRHEVCVCWLIENQKMLNIILVISQNNGGDYDNENDNGNDNTGNNNHYNSNHNDNMVIIRKIQPWWS